jgi:hypothetical protein
VRVCMYIRGCVCVPGSRVKLVCVFEREYVCMCVYVCGRALRECVCMCMWACIQDC